MKGEGGDTPPLLLGQSLPPYKPNQQDQYGGRIQNNLEIYRNLEGAIYTSPVQKILKELRGLEEELDQERRREQELFANMTKPFQVGWRLRPDDVFAILNFGKYEML